ncbi:MAG: hypothetical protein SD837_03865 [Candidatus Electrothrix scaldis]|jgi:hypothetical protein|nr:MAG: hypothetical protein SD837_03865 [Candidatus Electrothrix sp. GW3-3]
MRKSTHEPPFLEILIESGATAIPDRTVFEHLARRDNVPGVDCHQAGPALDKITPFFL